MDDITFDLLTVFIISIMLQMFYLFSFFDRLSHDMMYLWSQMCLIVGGNYYYYYYIIFLPGENPWWLKNYKESYEICLVVNLLWPVVINETIMQQNRIKTFHHNGIHLE